MSLELTSTAFSPSLQFSALARYDVNLFKDYRGFVSVGASHTGGMFNQPAGYPTPGVGSTPLYPATSVRERFYQPSYTTYDAAIANQQSLEAQIQAAQAQVDLSQINLDYTEIRSPIDGTIGRTAITEGNVVGPTSGVLTTIVSQNPMYVTFPVPLRQGLELRAQIEQLREQAQNIE